MTGRSKILILTPDLPYPPNDGLRLRMLQAIHSLSGHGEITLISFYDDNSSQTESMPSEILQASIGIYSIIKVAKPNQSLLKRVLGSILQFRTAVELTYQSNEFSKKIKQTLSNDHFDYCIILGGSGLLSYLQELNGMRVVVDLCDDIFAFYSRLSSIAKPLSRRLYLKTQALIFIVSLKRASAFVDEFIFISNKDADCMKKVDCIRWRVIPNYIDDIYFLADKKVERPKNKLLFVGAMMSKENKDAVHYFCSKIFPLVNSRHPDVIFRVVGKQGKSLQLSNHRQIEVEDYVDDLSVEYASCTIFVCPLRSGSGVKNKVLQAMAAGCAIVTTSIGAEGIGCSHGEELFIADSAEAFSSSISALLENPFTRESLGNAARRFSMKRFSQSSISEMWCHRPSEDSFSKHYA